MRTSKVFSIPFFNTVPALNKPKSVLIVEVDGTTMMTQTVPVSVASLAIVTIDRNSAVSSSGYTFIGG